jgi:hypothetical protein
MLDYNSLLILVLPFPTCMTKTAITTKQLPINFPYLLLKTIFKYQCLLMFCISSLNLKLSLPLLSRYTKNTLTIRLSFEQKKGRFWDVLYAFFLSIKNPITAIAIIIATIPAAISVIRSVVLTPTV